MSNATPRSYRESDAEQDGIDRANGGSAYHRDQASNAAAACFDYLALAIRRMAQGRFELAAFDFELTEANADSALESLRLAEVCARVEAEMATRAA